MSWHEPGPKLAKVQKKLSLASSIHPSPDDYQAAIAELQAEVARLKWMLHQFASGKFVAYDPQYGEDSEELVMADLAASYEEE